MDYNDINDVKEGDELPAVYAVVISTEPKNDEQQITAHNFTHRQKRTCIVYKRHLLYVYWICI